ncbi:DciA family protein [Segatella bryantii]|jgi:predicted nucleic acid-binding Zn ribbon protein|uniref:DUF721 domain-containing protein n=1 Tax=Segatella bryantii TaxID=77095 RepID=A0ABX4EJ47_SEGBR|nr:DUF721 domain-containing protein [Segatella bryantii]OYP56186.1 hypothetical protein CIK91_04025 [Segatella bryantii]UKK81220.1 DUF721 domain-containing protein [Segatella bryantii]
MFKRHPRSLEAILLNFIRTEGLETPLLQKRLIDSWPVVVGPSIAALTGEKYIKNQTLFVKILSPALRQDLSMMRSKLVQRLNAEVQAQIITEIRFY